MRSKSRVNSFNPWKQAKKEFTDFASYFLPTDDIWASSGTGDDSIPSLAYFEWLCERRVGVAYKIARKPADDAMRNRFTIRDFNGQEVNDDDILDWLEDTDFYNQLVQALYYERCYGTSFLMKYYTESDREQEDLTKPVKNKARPIAFQAFPPTLMVPIDTYKSQWLDTDPQKWTLQGGTYKTGKIDASRVHVFMTRRVSNRWRGLSVFEPIWISLMSYFQALIYLLRGFSEMGNVIPVWLIDSMEDDLDSLWDERESLLGEMKMNGKFIGKAGDTFQFPNTNLGKGINEIMEQWKEDISAGTNLPLPILFGRVTAAGLSGAAYLMAERYYWNEIANIQASLSDDVIRIIREAGFKSIDHKKRIDWNLSITKTDQQRLLDEGMEIQNLILKEDLIQRQINTSMMLEQYKQMQKTGNFTMGMNEQGENEQPQQQENKEKQVSKEPKRDFVIESILNGRKEQMDYLWGARKVA